MLKLNVTKVDSSESKSTHEIYVHHFFIYSTDSFIFHLLFIHALVLFLNIDSDYSFLKSYGVSYFIYVNRKDSVSSPL